MNPNDDMGTPEADWKRLVVGAVFGLQLEEEELLNCLPRSPLAAAAHHGFCFDSTVYRGQRSCVHGSLRALVRLLRRSTCFRSAAATFWQTILSYRCVLATLLQLEVLVLLGVGAAADFRAPER